jgi:hypothetical protein
VVSPQSALSPGTIGEPAVYADVIPVLPDSLVEAAVFGVPELGFLTPPTGEPGRSFIVPGASFTMATSRQHWHFFAPRRK